MINAAFKLQDSGFSREQVEALTAYWEGSLASKEDIAHLDGRITAEIADLRGEMVELRAEIKEDIARLEGKIETTAVELRGEMVELRAEIKEDIADLRGEVKADISELRTELKYIKWIGAVIIVGVLIPLIRDFLL